MEHFVNPYQGGELRRDAATKNLRFFAELQERTRAHGFFTHPFLAGASDAWPMSPERVTSILTSFYQVVDPFTRQLCALASRAPSLPSQFVLMDNVFEELGRGDLACSHPHLYLRMLESIGVSPSTAQAAEPVPAILRMQEHLAEVIERRPFAVACAVLASAESTIPASFPVLARVAQSAFPDVDLQFFARHGERDDEHAGDAAMLFALHADPSQWSSTEREVTVDLDCRAALLDAWTTRAA